MKLLPTSLLAFALCLSAPLRAEELQLSVIANNATHEEIWRLVQAAFKRAGLSAQPREVPAERALVLANAGTTDGDVGRIDGLEKAYPDLIKVPEPLYYYPSIAYSYRKLDVSRGWESLRPYTICIRRGIKVFELRTEGMRRQVLEDEKSLLRMLKTNGCEVAMLERHNPMVMAELVADPPLFQLSPALEISPLYLYLNKRHAALVPRIAEVLRQMRLDGSMQRYLGD